MIYKKFLPRASVYALLLALACMLLTPLSASDLLPTLSLVISGLILGGLVLVMALSSLLLVVIGRRTPPRGT